MKKRILATLISLLLAISLLAGCDSNSPGQSSSSPSGGDNTNTADSLGEDSNNELDETEIDTEESRFMKLMYATGFNVEYIQDNMKIVTDAEDQKFLLVPRGQDIPSGYDDMIILEIPLQRAIFGSTTHVGMIAPFDIWGSVAGITSPPGSGPMDDDIAASGYDIKYLGSWRTPDFELIQLINPDLVFVYTGTSSQVELIDKLEELDIPYAVNNEYMEMAHEGRMEWQLFFAPFFDIDEQVVSYVDEQFRKLEEMSQIIETVENRPKVAWGSVYQGTIYVSGPDSFVANQVRAAGGEFMHQTPGQLSYEDFYVTLADADVWILSMNANSVADIDALLEMVPVFEDAPVIINRQVWQFHVGYWYFTDQLADQVMDLAAIFHPDLFPDRTPFHYINLPSG
ncbi:MAG: ABC transporter substrate-binding protein [Oscillospiraceae bacterium]|nr:ABC transporter substrate-binding protein [Oscillospiraceae bacterium]